jgi:hypothetical protein
MSPEARMRLHLWLVWLWIVLTIATTVLALYLGESPFMAWVIAISGYANVCGHWSAREGAAPSASEES